MPTPVVQTNDLKNSHAETLRFPANLGANFVEGRSQGQQTQGESGVTPYVVFGAYQRRHVLNSNRGNDPKIFASTPDQTDYIILPLPASALATSSQVTYDGVSLGDIPALTGSIGQASDAVTKVMSQDFAGAKTDFTRASLGIVGQVGTAFIEGVSKLAGELGDNALNAGQATLGVARNPYTETMFKNVEFRTHKFDYTLVPHSYAESQIIDKIVQRLRFYMLPSFTTLTQQDKNLNSGFLLSYPYQFDIRYSVEATTFRIMPSVLTSMDVNYGGEDKLPMFYRGELNYPSRVTLGLTFQEVIFLTRGDIQTDSVTRSRDGQTLVSQYRF